MRLLADENVPGFAVKALRDHGHDVFWIRTEMPGAGDTEILNQAANDGRLLVTFDRDFGELVFTRGLPAESGVVLFRVTLTSPETVAERMVKALESRSDWASHFAVIDDYRVRMRPMPRGQR